MVLPALTWADTGLLILYGVVLWVPGGLVLAAAGARGWFLAVASPLLTYGLAGAGGPIVAALGMPWRWWTLPLITIVVAAVVGGARRLATSGPIPSPPPWHRAAHAAVGACVALAAAIGALAVLVGIKTLTALPQDWDAAYHANGIRWIVETGDGSLSGMSQVNWYGTTTSQYYPNAYHLLASTVTEVTGRDIPSVLNANTALIAGVAALGLAGLVRVVGGSAILAGASAVVLVGITAFYDMLWRGPLLPFAMGIALIPALLVTVEEFLRPDPLRDRVPSGIVLALGAAGLLALHPGALIAAIVFAVPMLVSRWWGTPRRLASEMLALAACGVLAIAVVVPHVLGSLASAAEASVDWPAVSTPEGAVGWVLLFSHSAESRQLWLAGALVVGALALTRLGPLRWIIVPTAVFAGLFVLAAASDAPLVEAVTRPWWNDRYRLIGIAALPLAVVAGHGIATGARGLADAVRRVVPATRSRPLALPVAAATAAAVLGGYLLVSGGSYLARNEIRMQSNVGDGPAVSAAEIEGFRVLSTLVGPTQRVMNDRGDGSVWMYALDGVRPVAGHYIGAGVTPDATLLEERFDDYDTDAAVRAAAQRLGVSWVVVDRGFLREDAVRQPGLRELDTVRALQVVYRNPDMTIYRLAPS
ncbi:DUF6541 family protein [Actinomycetospora aeridis]|uniref:DUF6541 family protein n=1 Tax=Actinomycetospora aeridis TaxID=3129231 RepID=A0ABU8N3S4_9PSEU